MLFPSDLRKSPALGRAVRVAGRVLCNERGRVTLVDAFASVVAEGEALSPLEPGDLVVLRGHWRGKRLERAQIVHHQREKPPTGDGEVGRLLFQGVGPNLQARHRALLEIRRYFSEEDFIEVETPMRVPAPGVDRNVEAIAARPAWLITSPELEMKRLVVAGIPRQFQLARASRREETGPLHEPEFCLLEWYRAFAGQEEVMRDTEALVSRVARAVRGRFELIAPDSRRIVARPPFERQSVEDAFRKYAGVRDVSDLASSDEARYFALLVERVEPALAKADRPIFLLDYPISQAALAQPLAKDPRFAERFELYAGGVELCNGYGELTDPREQRKRFLSERAQRKAEKRTVYPIHRRFLAALAEGMPETGGNALGIDRLLMLAVGARSVQEVMAFPESRL